MSVIGMLPRQNLLLTDPIQQIFIPACRGSNTTVQFIFLILWSVTLPFCQTMFFDMSLFIYKNAGWSAELFW